MTRTPEVFGPTVDDHTRCVHYATELDIIAIRFACCDRYYPCHLCHSETADHPAEYLKLWGPPDRAVGGHRYCLWGPAAVDVGATGRPSAHRHWFKAACSRIL